MATDKLITMKQFNGTDYDTLYPKTIASQVDGAYNKQEVIKDTTKSMFGYGSSAIPDTIFQWLGKYNQYWWKKTPVSGGVSEYVHSADRNAYPDTGTSGDYEYLYLGIPFDNAVTAPIFEYGSYIGTGTGGSTAPNSLTFDFTPRLVIICGDTEYSSGFADYSCKIIAVRGITSTDSIGEDGTSTYVAIEWTDKGLSWYGRSTSSSASILAKCQLNTSGKTYYYVAIG